jgi:hypothetical protein
MMVTGTEWSLRVLEFAQAARSIHREAWRGSIRQPNN